MNYEKVEYIVRFEEKTLNSVDDALCEMKMKKACG